MVTSNSTKALGAFLFVTGLLVATSCSNDKHVTKGVSDEYPCFRIIRSDTSSLSNKYISIGFIGLTKNALDATLLEPDGSPFVHIWGEDSDAPAREERPWRIGWSEKQKTFSLLYLSDQPVLLSRDLESFEGHELNHRFDGRAAVLTDDGKIVTVINQWEIVEDKYDHVDGDSVPINWTLWHVEDSIGNKEIIDLSTEYADIDVYGYGTHIVQGQEQATLDPLHGNSADYSTSDNITYFGMSMRTLNEILIYAKDGRTNQHRYYHFGGPFNDFDFAHDSIIAYKAHDFRFVNTSDTLVTISFYSNGDGHSIGGLLATGKVVELDLKRLSAKLVSQSIASTTHSLWMGSYESTTNCFSPGIIEFDEITSNSVLWYSPVLYKELDNKGRELIRLEASYFCPMVAYRSDRYAKDSIDKVIKRPRLSVKCEDNKIVAEASKDGEYDELMFFLNDSEWKGNHVDEDRIELESNFSGKISVMSRLKIEKYKFNVDKYSKPIFVSENYCSQPLVH